MDAETPKTRLEIEASAHALVNEGNYIEITDSPDIIRSTLAQAIESERMRIQEGDGDTVREKISFGSIEILDFLAANLSKTRLTEEIMDRTSETTVALASRITRGSEDIAVKYRRLTIEISNPKDLNLTIESPDVIHAAQELIMTRDAYEAEQDELVKATITNGLVEEFGPEGFIICCSLAYMNPEQIWERIELAHKVYKTDTGRGLKAIDLLPKKGTYYHTVRGREHQREGKPDAVRGIQYQVSHLNARNEVDEVDRLKFLFNKINAISAYEGNEVLLKNTKISTGEREKFGARLFAPKQRKWNGTVQASLFSLADDISRMCFEAHLNPRYTNQILTKTNIRGKYVPRLAYFNIVDRRLATLEKIGGYLANLR